VTDLMAIARRPFRDSAWGTGLSAGVVVVLGYGVVAEAVNRFYFRPAAHVPLLDRPILPILAALLVVVFTLRLVYSKLLRGVARPPASLLASILVFVAAVQVLLLPQEVAPPSPPVHAQALASAQSVRVSAPLLFIGLDGGTWTAIDPLMRSHQLSFLEAISS